MEYNIDSKDNKKLIIILFIITIIALPDIYELGKKVYINIVGDTVQGYVDSYDVDYIEYHTKGSTRESAVYTPLIIMNNEDGYIRLKSSYNEASGLKYREGDTLEMKYINNDLVTAVIVDPFYIYSEIAKITSVYGIIGVMLAIGTYKESKKNNRMHYFKSSSEKRALKLAVKEKKKVLLLMTPGLVSTIATIMRNNSFPNGRSYSAIFYIMFIGIYIVVVGNLIFNAIKLRRVKELD